MGTRQVIRGHKPNCLGTTGLDRSPRIKARDVCPRITRFLPAVILKWKTLSDSPYHGHRVCCFCLYDWNCVSAVTNMSCLFFSGLFYVCIAWTTVKTDCGAGFCANRQNWRTRQALVLLYDDFLSDVTIIYEYSKSGASLTLEHTQSTAFGVGSYIKIHQTGRLPAHTFGVFWIYKKGMLPCACRSQNSTYLSKSDILVFFPFSSPEEVDSTVDADDFNHKKAYQNQTEQKYYLYWSPLYFSL